MIARKTTVDELNQALNIVNAKYDNNVEFRDIHRNGSAIRFTLKVKDSKKAGHRLGFQKNKNGNRRRINSACWHVHGDFFDTLFNINPQATIRSRGNLITTNGGNWIDDNIGSMMEPLYFSEACDCQ